MLHLSVVTWVSVFLSNVFSEVSSAITLLLDTDRQEKKTLSICHGQTHAQWKSLTPGEGLGGCRVGVFLAWGQREVAPVLGDPRGKLVPVVCSKGDSFEVYLLRALGGCCRSSHATFAVPAAFFRNMASMTAFLRSCRGEPFIIRAPPASLWHRTLSFFMSVESESHCSWM